MSLTPSNMMPLGTSAPSFSLKDTISGKTISLDSLKSDKGTVVMFICNHCPYVQHIISHVVEVAKNYQKKGIAFIAINSNDAQNYPADAPNKMKENAIDLGFTFPYLYDENQDVAKSYDAACTPEFFVFDKKLACVYRGRFDDATPSNKSPVTGKDLTAALDHLLSNTPINSDQKSSIGCNIKWK
ncbi:MAG: thioredoxin family protein [Gammaproteobacteria bacterium]|nr:thioredoxin family protein [Gammaproteobacteria bacterium]